MKITAIIFPGMLLLGATGCVTTQVANLQPQAQADLPVYLSKSPARTYTELKYIEAAGGLIHNKKQLLAKLKQQAQRENADALVNVRFGYAGLYPYVEGVAVKFTE